MRGSLGFLEGSPPLTHGGNGVKSCALNISSIGLPIVALALAGGWCFWQFEELSLLKQEQRELQQRLVQKASQPSRANVRDGGGRQGAEISWQLFSGKDEAGQRSALAGFRDRLSKMSRDEMEALLDEMAGLNFDPALRNQLDSLVLGRLLLIDPEKALAHYAGRVGDASDPLASLFVQAFGRWARLQPHAAEAWLDKLLAEGQLESKTLEPRNEMQLLYEGVMLELLIDADLGAARKRFIALPESQRLDVFQKVSIEGQSLAGRTALALFAREYLPVGEQPGAFGHIGQDLVGKGFPELSEFLVGISASPAERQAAAKVAANSWMEFKGLQGGLTKNEVDRLRSWLVREAPGMVDQIAGKALAEAAQVRGKFGFSEAADLVLAYHRVSANDDLLVSFLRGYSARSNLDEARHLASQIRDPQVREVILNQWK